MTASPCSYIGKLSVLKCYCLCSTQVGEAFLAFFGELQTIRLKYPQSLWCQRPTATSTYCALIMSTPQWLRDMAASILEDQLNQWKEHRSTASSHAWKELNSETSRRQTPVDAQRIQPDDARIGEGALVDLSACSKATQQPPQFFQVSLDTLLTIIPDIILPNSLSNFDVCTTIHEAGMA